MDNATDASALTIWVTKGDPRSREESNLDPSRRVPTSVESDAESHTIGGRSSALGQWRGTQMSPYSRYQSGSERNPGIGEESGG